MNGVVWCFERPTHIQNAKWIPTGWPQHLPHISCAFWGLLDSYCFWPLPFNCRLCLQQTQPIQSLFNVFELCRRVHSLTLSLFLAFVRVRERSFTVWLVTWKNGCCYFARLNFNFLACGQIQTTFLILVLFSSCLHFSCLLCVCRFFFVRSFVEIPGWRWRFLPNWFYQ